MTLRKAFISGILAIALTLTGCVSVEWNPEHYLVPQLMPTAVTVKTAYGSGSGVWVSDSHVLTAKHVVDGTRTNRVTVVGPDGTKTDGWVSVSFEKGINQDWAIIRAAKPANAVVAEISCDAPLIGSRVIMFGNSMGSTGLLPYFGWVEWLDYDTTENGAPPSYWKSADLMSFHGAAGTSGGPVFNREGKLIGLEVGSMNGRGGTFKQVVQQIRSTFLCGK